MQFSRKKQAFGDLPARYPAQSAAGDVAELLGVLSGLTAEERAGLLAMAREAVSSRAIS